MTPEALASWRAQQKALGRTELQALLRACRSAEPTLVHPLMFAIVHGGTRIDQALTRATEIERQAGELFGGGLLAHLRFLAWWDDTPHAERCAALAAEVEADLDRRDLRAGASEN